jgi:transposase
MVIPSFIIPPGLKLSKAVLVNQAPGLLIAAVSAQKRSACPCCGKLSKSVHGFYDRSLCDLPVSGKAVRVILRVRKFFCKNRNCTRIVFTERFDDQIKPYKRCFSRSADLVRSVGTELGGNRGAALCKAIGHPISPSTVLRTLKGISISVRPLTSGVIGVDDWAYKKGRNYGTIIVDLIDKEVVDLLPDREADTLEAWLKAHPEVHTVSRDRASAYALGVRNGAPAAIQVADRFHLLVNLKDAFQRSLRKHSTVIKKCFEEIGTGQESALETEDKKGKNEEPPKATETPTLSFRTEERGPMVGNVGPDRQFKFQKAKELHQKGYGIKTIAKQLKAGRKTIRKYLASEHLVSREVNRSRTMTNFGDFETDLVRLYKPNTTYLELFNRISEMGFNGKYTQFCQRMNTLINDGETAKTRKDRLLPILKPAKTWSLSKLAFIAMAKTGTLKEEEQKYLDLLLQKSPEIKRSTVMAHSFRQLFVAKAEGSLAEWIKLAVAEGSPLKGFAKGISQDYEAVNQAVVSTISNGQVEGQVNKLKTIKRRMYGRAGFELLRKIVLTNSS